MTERKWGRLLVVGCWALLGMGKSEVKKMEWAGQFCGEEKAGAKIIQEQSAWEEIWKSVLNPKAPPVDFKKYFAVIIFLGSRPTGGFAVQFLEPKQEKEKTVVRYRVKTPGKGSFVIQAFTQPYAIRLFPKTSSDIQIQEVK
ncbi:MAG: protease complex subunit PrcB family protein [Elusimicrobia bacterium]|nr:protease complex subunit PrcB family protein [Elusimicrobiota bacterium]